MYTRGLGGTPLCTPLGMVGMYHPVHPWVCSTLYTPGYTYHAPLYTGVPGHDVHHGRCAGEGTLGSNLLIIREYEAQRDFLSFKV